MDFEFITNKETNEFIEKYLQMNHPPINTNRDELLIESNWQKINADLVKPNVNEDDIFLYVKAFLSDENRDKFDNTLYWYICADKIKSLNWFYCFFNKKHDRSILIAHHNSYINHGREVQHINEAMVGNCPFDLVCICDPCHAREHNRKPNEKKINGSMYVSQNGINNLDAMINEVKIFNTYKSKLPVVNLPVVNQEDTSIENSIRTQRIISVHLEEINMLLNKPNIH